jgi:hypothetical protein
MALTRVAVKEGTFYANNMLLNPATRNQAPGPFRNWPCPFFNNNIIGTN